MSTTPRRAVNLKALTALAGLAMNALGDPDAGGPWPAVKKQARELVARDPLDATAVTVLSAAYLFWQCERGVNPKVRTFADALVFVTTSLSVGYADTFARSERGKVIASWLNTVGPSLAAKLFDAPAAEREAEARDAQETQRRIADRLDKILAVLERQGAPKG